jgi:hypothetical protein
MPWNEGECSRGPLCVPGTDFAAWTGRRAAALMAWNFRGRKVDGPEHRLRHPHIAAKVPTSSKPPRYSGNSIDGFGKQLEGLGR